MEALSAPWRMAYIRGEKPTGCVLCTGEEKACEEYIVKRGKTAFVMMNLYPYSSGHVMVVPCRHVACVEDLNREERAELFDLTILSVKVLKEALRPEGINVGLNLGEAAGAGVRDHLHIHVVPRWNGDTNFMSVVADVRVIPEDVSETRKKLASYFNRADEEELL